MTVPPHFEADASPELQEIVERIRAGEEVVIDEAGTPVAKVIAFPTRPRHRRPGLWKGKVALGEDWDSDEVNEQIAADFAASEIWPTPGDRP